MISNSGYFDHDEFLAIIPKAADRLRQITAREVKRERLRQATTEEAKLYQGRWIKEYLGYVNVYSLMGHFTYYEFVDLTFVKMVIKTRTLPYQIQPVTNEKKHNLLVGKTFDSHKTEHHQFRHPINFFDDEDKESCCWGSFYTMCHRLPPLIKSSCMSWMCCFSNGQRRRPPPFLKKLF